MEVKLTGRSFLKLFDFNPDELRYLLNLSATLKLAKREGREQRELLGKSIALLFEKDSTRTRCAFEVAAFDQGANITYIGPSGSQMGHKESMKDTARVLGRFYNGIEYRGYAQSTIEELARYAGVPVWNGLTDEFHPTQALADLLTMQEATTKPLGSCSVAFMGDAHNNVAVSLMVGASLMGMDFRACAPRECWPANDVLNRCKEIAKSTGASITVTDNVEVGVRGCDFVYTDVWVSMGEPDDIWAKRIKLLKPYQVNSRVMALTNNTNCKLLHCLPAFHNRQTTVGESMYKKFRLDAMEVTDDVFESDASIVFNQAENRLHTIKAVMVATMV